MKHVKATAIAAIIALAGMTGVVQAQDSTSPQDQPGGPGSGYMMGPWMGGMGMGGMGMGGMGMGGQGMGGMMNDGAMPMMGWGRHGAAMCGMMSSHLDGRLAYQKAELKIATAQESLWDAYAKVVRASAEDMTAHCTTMMDAGGAQALSLPDRLEQHEKFMETRIEAMRTLNKTLKPLYAAFSAEQKKAADQMIWGPMGMM